MNHFSTVTKVAHTGATIAALVVAIGASIGFHDMTGSWALAALGGVGIASVLALGWYSLITMGARVRRTGTKAITVALGVVLVAAALGTSGWALATAIGGKQALSAYQIRAVDEFQTALSEAKASVDSQRLLVDTVQQHSTAASLLGDEEGRSGQGPLFRSYQRTSENLTSAATQMSATLNEGDRLYEDGRNAIAKANASLGSAGEFRDWLNVAHEAIIGLNAISIVDDLLGVGMVGLNDRGLPELNDLTQSLRNTAEGFEVTATALPSYQPKTRADAVMSERPMGAWIVAFAIDTAPLLLLLMVMAAAGEPLLRDERKVKARTTDDEIREDERVVEGTNVRAFPGE